DARVRSMDSPTALLGNDLLLNSLGVSDRGYRGATVGVAVIDSGFEPAAQSDFYSLAAFFDFTSGNANPVPTWPRDNYGHGTHLGGLISSSGRYSSGLYQGLAPGVRLIVLKALDENGEGYTSAVVNAINFAVAKKAALGIDVINLSLGH